jgi:hypothetical protein
MTQGNNYILGSVTYADAGPFNAPPSGPPGSNYTMAEFTTPTDQLVLRAGGSTIASDLHNSGVIDFAAWLNHESSATKPDTAANLTGTDNMLQHGVYETYPGKNFTLGFYPSDGSRVAGNNPNVFINKMTSPGTDFGSTGGFLLGDGSTVPPNNTVPKVAISGILPAGAVYAYDRTNYDPADPAHDQTFQGGWIDSNYLSAIFHNNTASTAENNTTEDATPPRVCAAHGCSFEVPPPRTDTRPEVADLCVEHRRSPLCRMTCVLAMSMCIINRAGLCFKMAAMSWRGE